MNRPNIVVIENPDSTDRDVVHNTLKIYNDKAGGPSGYEPLAVMIVDPASGEKLGGLWGRTIYGWLVIELVAVPEQFRGQDIGSEILRRAEIIARGRGCKGAWVDTYEFQAPGFYQKHGFEEFGRIQDHPPGSSRIYLKKNFT